MILAFPWMVCHSAQTTVHLRYGGGAKIPVAGASNATPIQIATATAHGFTPGQVIWCWGIQNNWNADGTRKVIAVQDSTHFTVQYMNGNPAVGNGPFSADSRIGAWCGSTVAYTLTAHPRLHMNGPGGSLTARMQDPDGTGSQTAPRARNGWPPWDAFGNKSNGWLATKIGSNYKWNGTNYALLDLGYFDAIYDMALAWFGDNSQAANKAGAIHWIDNAERITETLACDTTQQSCGDHNGGDQNTTRARNIALTYDVMYSQLGPSNISYFTNMMLNDITDGETCTSMYTKGTGTVSGTSSGTMTGVGTTWTTTGGPGGGPLVAGDAVFPAGQNPWTVIRVTDDTHLTYRTGDSGDAAANFSSTAYQVAGPWQSGNCGFVYWQKHSNPVMNMYNAYPHGDDAENVDLFANHNIGLLAEYLEIGSATADDDPRGARLFEGAANSWTDYQFPLYQAYWSGPTQADSQYTSERFYRFAGEAAWVLYNSTGGAVDYLAGNWLSNSALFDIYKFLPASGNGREWALAYGGSNMCLDTLIHVANPPIFSGVLQVHDPTTAAYNNYYQQTVRGDFTVPNINISGCYNCSWNYVYSDPGFTQANYTSVLPTAHAFITTDALAKCPTCNTNMIIDRTGWTKASDTLLDIVAWDIERDTNQLSSPYTGTYNPASYGIWKNHQMLGEDSNPGVQCVPEAGGNGYMAYDQSSMYMEVGGTMNLKDPSGGVAAQSTVLTPRYADGGTGTNKNKYMYAMVDASGAYTAAAAISRLNRHFVDFKADAPNAQYIIVYDDVATSNGKMKRTYLHYPNNGQNGEGKTTYAQSGNSVVSLDGRGGAALLTKVLFPGATGFTYTDNPDGSYKGGAGQTFRVSICAGAGTTAAGCDATNTAAEFLTVHKPSMNQSGVMPTLSQPSCTGSGGNCTVVEIADSSSPKVAALARQGALLTGASFTTTHAGVAQYLVAGLMAGTYAVTVGGTAVSGSPFTVGAKDNTLYFESTAGTVSVSRAGGSAR